MLQMIWSQSVSKPATPCLPPVNPAKTRAKTELARTPVSARIRAVTTVPLPVVAAKPLWTLLDATVVSAPPGAESARRLRTAFPSPSLSLSSSLLSCSTVSFK
ncbi:hypothetical protein O0L34_g9307 [Tuta absoluta]|nr:hypothetical protein O0L34_g9307 [Tuta absoluta]